ncbi:hypothetical protein [Streptomyces sp. NPDC001903]|uniref:hypothetical protein n=1 Tax=Streptomyces sp. NPDC001903 TaxID=3364622 RepID=UPI00367D8FA7
MVPVGLSLTRTGGGAPEESHAHALADTLWAHAAPEYAIEHIRAWTQPDGIGITLFIRAASVGIAHARAERLMAAALASGAAAARGYSLTFLS